MPKALGSNLVKLSIALAFLLALMACRQSNDTVDTVIQLLENRGYQVGGRSLDRVPFIWQDDAARIQVNGEPIVLFQYEDELTLKRGIESIQFISDQGTGLWDLDENTPEEDILYSRGVMLVFLGGHKDSASLRGIFDSSLRVKVVGAGGAVRVTGGER